MATTKLHDNLNKTRSTESPKDDLYQIIKSLDKNEKGYFKKFATRYGEKDAGNDYLKLFDLLDKAEVYDEQKLKKQLAKTGKVTNFSAQKAYLYEQIIKALRSYASGKSTRYNLTERLLDIQNLIDRGLTEQAMDMIHDAAKKAQRNEHYEILIQLKQFEDGLMVRNLGQYAPAEVMKVKDEIALLAEKINEEQQINTLIYKMKLVDDKRGHHELVSDDLIKEADELINHPAIKNIPNMSNKGKLHAYALLHLHAGIANNDAEALRYMKLRHDVFAQMELDQKATYTYLANVSNIIMASLNLNDVKEATYFLHVLEKTRFKDKLTENYRQRVYAKSLLMVLMVNSVNKIAEDEVLAAEKHYLATNPEATGNNNLMSAYYIGILFFGAGRTDKALQWFTLCQEHKNTTFLNVQAYCRILSAIAHYSHNTPSLMESAIQSAIYFTKKNNLASPFLRSAISLLQKLQTQATARQQKAFFEETLPTIQEMYNSFNGEITYFHDFDLRLWWKSKINNSTYGIQLTHQADKTPETQTQTVTTA